jgi:hypothetical protein
VAVDKPLSIEASEVNFRFPFPHYYIKATPLHQGNTAPLGLEIEPLE